jgi:hypothetical protein
MIKKLVTTIAALTLTTAAYAFDITIGGPPGGTSQRVSEVISVALKHEHVDVNVNYTAGCPVVKSNIENGQKTVYLTTAYVMSMPECSLQFNKDVVLLDELYVYTNALCHRKERYDLRLENFLEPELRKVIASNIFGEASLKKVVQKLGIEKNSKIVVVGNSGKVRQAILSTEFDYALVDAIWASQNTDKVSCIFVGSDDNVMFEDKTVPSIQKFIKKKTNNDVGPLFQDVFVLIGSGLNDEEKLKIKKELAIVRKSNEWQLYINQFGNSSTTLEQNKYNKIIEILKGN